MNIPANLRWTDCFSLRSWLSARGFIGKNCICCYRLRRRSNTCTYRTCPDSEAQRRSAQGPARGCFSSPGRLKVSRQTRSAGQTNERDKQASGCLQGVMGGFPPALRPSLLRQPPLSLALFLVFLLHETQQERRINEPDYCCIKQAVSTAVYTHLFFLSRHKCDPGWRVSSSWAWAKWAFERPLVAGCTVASCYICCLICDCVPSGLSVTGVTSVCDFTVFSPCELIQLIRWCKKKKKIKQDNIDLEWNWD